MSNRKNVTLNAFSMDLSVDPYKLNERNTVQISVGSFMMHKDLPNKELIGENDLITP